MAEPTYAAVMFGGRVYLAAVHRADGTATGQNANPEDNYQYAATPTAALSAVPLPPGAIDVARGDGTSIRLFQPPARDAKEDEQYQKRLKAFVSIMRIDAPKAHNNAVGQPLIGAGKLAGLTNHDLEAIKTDHFPPAYEAAHNTMVAERARNEPARRAEISRGDQAMRDAERAQRDQFDAAIDRMHQNNLRRARESAAPSSALASLSTTMSPSQAASAMAGRAMPPRNNYGGTSLALNNAGSQYAQPQVEMVNAGRMGGVNYEAMAKTTREGMEVYLNKDISSDEGQARSFRKQLEVLSRNFGAITRSLGQNQESGTNIEKDKLYAVMAALQEKIQDVETEAGKTASTGLASELTASRQIIDRMMAQTNQNLSTGDPALMAQKRHDRDVRRMAEHLATGTGSDLPEIKTELRQNQRDYDQSHRDVGRMEGQLGVMASDKTRIAGALLRAHQLMEHNHLNHRSREYQHYSRQFTMNDRKLLLKYNIGTRDREGRLVAGAVDPGTLSGEGAQDIVQHRINATHEALVAARETETTKKDELAQNSTKLNNAMADNMAKAEEQVTLAEAERANRPKIAEMERQERAVKAAEARVRATETANTALADRQIANISRLQGEAAGNNAERIRQAAYELAHNGKNGDDASKAASDELARVANYTPGQLQTRAHELETKLGESKAELIAQNDRLKESIRSAMPEGERDEVTARAPQTLAQLKKEAKDLRGKSEAVTAYNTAFEETKRAYGADNEGLKSLSLKDQSAAQIREFTLEQKEQSAAIQTLRVEVEKKLALGDGWDEKRDDQKKALVDAQVQREVEGVLDANRAGGANHVKAVVSGLRVATTKMKSDNTILLAEKNEQEKLGKDYVALKIQEETALKGRPLTAEENQLLQQNSRNDLKQIITNGLTAKGLNNDDKEKAVEKSQETTKIARISVDDKKEWVSSVNEMRKEFETNLALTDKDWGTLNPDQQREKVNALLQEKYRNANTTDEMRTATSQLAGQNKGVALEAYVQANIARHEARTGTPADDATKANLRKQATDFARSKRLTTAQLQDGTHYMREDAALSALDKNKSKTLSPAEVIEGLQALDGAGPGGAKDGKLDANELNALGGARIAAILGIKPGQVVEISDIAKQFGTLMQKHNIQPEVAVASADPKTSRPGGGTGSPSSSPALP